MAMALRVKSEVDPLEREQREIQRRRERFQERTGRILDPKLRTMGRDVEGLRVQVEEKQRREEEERRRNANWDQLSTLHARIGLEQERDASAWRSAQSQELLAFRQEQSREKQQRDWEEAQVSRGPSGYLSFQGEDEIGGARTRAQQSQQHAWLAQQLQDLRDKEEGERQQDMQYDARVQQVNEVQQRAQSRHDEWRARQRKETQDFNVQLARAKQERERVSAHVNQALNDQELAATLTSPLLNEQGNFRGLTVAERQEIVDTQQLQASWSRSQRMRDEHNDRLYAQEKEQERRALVLQERAQQQRQREARLALRDVHRAQQHEQQQRKQQLNELYTNHPADEGFFSRFGTSCR